jgi:hypothetical protein
MFDQVVKLSRCAADGTVQRSLVQCHGDWPAAFDPRFQHASDIRGRLGDAAVAAQVHLDTRQVVAQVLQFVANDSTRPSRSGSCAVNSEISVDDDLHLNLLE